MFMSKPAKKAIQIMLCWMVLTGSIVWAYGHCFIENFSDTIDTAVWVNAGGSTVDLGGGDYAWTATDGNASGNVGLATVNTFPRGNNLRVFFRTWHNFHEGGRIECQWDRRTVAAGQFDQ